MKRACPTASAALVMFLSSFAVAADGARFVIPLPSAARLCPDNSLPCISGSLLAGADLAEFVARHSEAGKTYRLTLQLPAGEFALRETWRIDGSKLPQQISELSIAGVRSADEQPRTWLSGSRTLADLGAAATERPDGTLLIDMPEPFRARLMSMRQYRGDDSAWLVLKDQRGELNLTQWPARDSNDGWRSFSRRTAPETDLWIPLGREAPVTTWHDEQSAWVLGFFRHGWHADYERLAEARQDEPAIRLGLKPRYGLGNSGRFRVLNLCSQVRRPGDYCIDATRGRLQVFPRAPLAKETLRLSVLEEPLLQVLGARHIDIELLGFKDTRGHALVVGDSANVRLSQLAFEHIGRSGVVIDGGHDVLILASSFTDIGGDAAVLRGGDRLTLAPSGHRIEGCRIRRPSQRLATPGTAIRLEGVGHVVRGNTIEDAPISAVYFDGNDHLVEGNWIERVCLEVDDAGAIYAGRDWTYRGNVIRHNVIASMPQRDGTANLNAIYLDDMLSGATVSANLVFDVPRGVLVGGGRDNLLEGNLFVRTRTTFHIDQRALEWASPSAQPGGVMFDRLTRVPYRDDTWRHAYPALANILAQRPAHPLNNVAQRNASLRSGAAVVTPAAESGRIESPTLLDTKVPVPGSVREFLASCTAEPVCAGWITHLGLPAYKASR